MKVADVVAGAVVPEGELIPKRRRRATTTPRGLCRVGPDNKLYIQLRSALQRAGKGETRHLP